MSIKLLTIGHSYVVSLNRSLMRELHRLGKIDVTVGAPRFFHGDLRSLSMEPEEAGSGLQVVPIDTYLSKRVHFFAYNPRELKQLIASQKFDYCYLWEEPYIVSGYQIARELKKQNIPYAIFSAQNILKKYPWPFSYFEVSSIHGAHQLWPCGELVAECLEQKGFGSVPRQIIPLPVDLNHFHPMSNESKASRRHELGLNVDKVIGFMGRLTPEKGCRVFMDVADQLLSNPRYGALVVGSGPMESDIKRWAERYKGRVHVSSALHSEVPQYLGVMDALLCPSQNTSFWLEQFGRMIVEAMACGVPVLGSRSGEIPYVIHDAGVVVSPKDRSEWKQQAHKVLEDQEFSQKLVQKGLLRAQNYSALSIAKVVQKNILAGLNNIK